MLYRAQPPLKGFRALVSHDAAKVFVETQIADHGIAFFKIRGSNPSASAKSKRHLKDIDVAV